MFDRNCNCLRNYVNEKKVIINLSFQSKTTVSTAITKGVVKMIIRFCRSTQK